MNPRMNLSSNHYIPVYFRKNILLENPTFFADSLIAGWQSYVEYKSDTNPDTTNSKLMAKIEALETQLERLRRDALIQTDREYLSAYHLLSQQNVFIANSTTGYDDPIPQGMTLSTYYSSQIRYSDYGYNTVIGPAIPVTNNIKTNNIMLLELSRTHALALKQIIDLPQFHCENTPASPRIFHYGSHLMISIANTFPSSALALIQSGANINQYSPHYGNTPLLLVISKGWNHIDDSERPRENELHERSQQPIITALLDAGADVNAIHLKNGMTALHIALLRGDDVELIKLLLTRGAKLDCVDFMGRTPVDLLSFEYDAVQEIVGKLLDDSEFGSDDLSENKSFVATLPTKADRARNIEAIKTLLIDYKHNSDLSSLRHKR
jgi:hypothetical protein